MSGASEKMSFNKRTGIVHIPSVNRSGLTGPCCYGKCCELDNGKNMHLLMRPHNQQGEAKEVSIEFTLPPSLLPDTQSYKVSMRFQTNHEQEAPLQLSIKRGNRNQPVIHTMEIPLPNTLSKWQTLPPLPMDLDLGGLLTDTIVEFRHPSPQGKGILIRDVSLIPVWADESGEYSAKWFDDWTEALRAKVLPELFPNNQNNDKDNKLLTLPSQKAFQDACQDAKSAHCKQEKCGNDAAKQQQATKEFQTAMKQCLETATPLLEEVIVPALASIDWKCRDDERTKELLQCIVLVHATPARLAAYCAKGEQHKQRLLDFLHHNVYLMYEMLVHGGPRGGSYGKALDIYAELEAHRQRNKSVLSKLALAVALELAEPISEFGSNNKDLVDPIERYLHYEQAYLEGELDPAFENFTVWELRMVVNSDAPNEQLAWFRSMIRNYNPSIALRDDYHWRYAWIVRTDVYYKDPEWTHPRHDYIQLVSGGGKCGPRAWMGRFACKAFGTPTWGCRQPGHAALGRWTPNGWVTALGAGFDKSFWDDRHGPDFVCETKIRESLGDEAYFQRAEMLHWIGIILGEKHIGSYVDSSHVWSSLAIVQRIKLSQLAAPKTTQEVEQSDVLSQITEMKQKKPGEERITKANDGSIVIPVDCKSSAKGNTDFMKSFLGGRQAFLKPGWNLSYKLPAHEVKQKQKYNLTARVVTIHEKDPAPLIVSVKDERDNSMREYCIQIPYSMGKWQETEPVEIELGEATEIISFSRKEQIYPMTIKDFKLTPCRDLAPNECDFVVKTHGIDKAPLILDVLLGTNKSILPGGGKH